MVALAFGLIVVAMVYTVGKVSGCHINPAVTFALAATKRFPWRGVPAYWSAQVAGGIAGALAIWASFGSRVFDFGAGFGVVDFNHDVTSWGSAMFVEALATAILLFTILGIVDTRSPEGWAGLVIGLVIVAIIITVGPITNASINPARALGPLLISDLNGSSTTGPSSCWPTSRPISPERRSPRSPTTGSRRPGSSSGRSRRPSPSPTGPTHSRPPPTPRRIEMSSTDVATVKKFLNNPDDLVPGVACGPGLGARRPADGRLRRTRSSSARARRCSGKVGLVSGGGSGHEPMHGGFVGLGMLDAACPGAVFTSPVPDQMLAATKAVDGGAGVVHIVKNYTGDVLNFRMAAELAGDEGIQVESILTNDDVAVEDSLYTAGRRGVGVTVLVEKIAGAKAEAGGTLAEVAAIARKVNAQGGASASR